MLWLPVALLLVAAMDAPPPGGLTEALAREERGDDAGALQALQAIIQASPSAPLPRLEAARLRLKGGGEDLDAVERDLDVAAAAAPHNPQLHYLRGLLWEERGKPLHAVHAYEEALQSRPSYEDARFRLAGLCASIGDWLKAELHYRHLATAHPEWVQVRLQLAQAFEHQGRVPETEALLVRLRGERPQDVVVLRALAGFYERTGRAKEAAKLRALLQPPEPKKRSLKPSRR